MKEDVDKTNNTDAVVDYDLLISGTDGVWDLQSV